MPRNRRRGFTLLELMIVVAIILLLAAIAIPAYSHARLKSQGTACVNNLRALDGTKQQYALDHQLDPRDDYFNRIPLSDLVPDYIKKVPDCPAGGIYILRNPGRDPICSVGGGHSL